MKIVFSIVVACLLFLAQPGCDSSSNTVVEAPTGEIDESAMQGMTDEEYDAAMDAAMEEDR